MPACGQRPETAAHAWRQTHLVSLVRVQAVTHLAGVPAPASDGVYLRGYATRMITTSADRPVASDGVTVQLTRSGSRRLAGTGLCC